jgi:N-dimethylarginine dimethylaminohydrolase
MIAKSLLGAQSDSGLLTRIVLRKPEEAFVSQTALEQQWHQLHYPACPIFDKALHEYERFVKLIASTGAEIIYAPHDDLLTIDSIYIRDSMVVTDNGVILCSMGKKARQHEPAVAEQFLRDQGIPILGTISSDGRLEGGDMIWLDAKTLVVGLGYRTNAEGIRQLKEITASTVDELIVVPLPHWNGPDDVMHLMSNISPIDKDLAVVYSPLLPVTFRELLVDREITLVEVPDNEYRTMACNVLAIAPRKAIMLDGNPETQKRLAEHGVEVLTYIGDEISRKGAGGPTCLTRPLQRMEN